MEFEAYKTKVETTVTQALMDGKLAAYQRDWAFRTAMNDIDGFTLWLKNAPQVVPMGELSYASSQHKNTAPRSRAHELMGLSTEDIKNYGGKNYK